MIEPSPRRAVQNLNTFQAIVAPDLCILEETHYELTSKLVTSRSSNHRYTTNGTQIHQFPPENYTHGEAPTRITNSDDEKVLLAFWVCKSRVYRESLVVEIE